MGRSKKGNSASDEYYVLPDFMKMLATPLILYIFFMASFPTVIPNYIGPIGSMVIYIGQNYNKFTRIAFYAVSSEHTALAIWGTILCSNLRFSTWTTTKWFLTNLFFGLFSFPHLYNRYKRGNKNN